MSWRLPKGWPQGDVPEDLARFGLGPRLARIASMVPRGRTVADIGTDHGLIPIALVGSGRCPRAIAIDRSEAPLERARRNAARLGVQVELRLGDSLLPGEAEVAIIAGMGGRAICSLLRTIRGVERIVLQPNTDFEDVRRALAAGGYSCMAEHLVADDDRFFLVIAADHGQPRELSLSESFLGGIVEDPLFPVWTERQRSFLVKKCGALEAILRLRLLDP